MLVFSHHAASEVAPNSGRDVPHRHAALGWQGASGGLGFAQQVPADLLNRSRQIRNVAPLSRTSLYDYCSGKTHRGRSRRLRFRARSARAGTLWRTRVCRSQRISNVNPPNVRRGHRIFTMDGGVDVYHPASDMAAPCTRKHTLADSCVPFRRNIKRQPP